MSDAVVTIPFKGVPDGEAHPKHFSEGDIITGDLARVAVEEKWAVDADSAAAAAAGGGEGGDLTEVNGLVEIPADWPKLKWFALKALAQKISGSPVNGVDEARTIIEREIDRRANPDTSGAGEVGGEGDESGATGEAGGAAGNKEGAEGHAGAGGAQAGAGGDAAAGTQPGTAAAG